MTKLEAVNEMLAAIGEPPVASLPDSDDGSEEYEAKVLLESTCEKILAEGWFCNTVEEKAYQPDANNKIDLSSEDPGILSITPAGKSIYMKLVLRNGYVYDIENDTDEFDEDEIELDVVQNLDFEVLPPLLAYYITKAAAVKFQRNKKRGLVDDNILQQEMYQARIAARQEDTDLRRANVFDTYDAMRILAQD